MTQSRKVRTKTTMNVFPHESAFKPARRGHGDALGKYPQFINKKTSEEISPQKKTKEDNK